MPEAPELASLQTIQWDQRVSKRTKHNRAPPDDVNWQQIATNTPGTTRNTTVK
jgi:hypothetical protein